MVSTSEGLSTWINSSLNVLQLKEIHCRLFSLCFFFSSNFHIEQTLTNGSTSADGCPYLCRTSLKSTYDVCWTRNMKEEKSKTKMNKPTVMSQMEKKKKISWFRGENAPVRRRKKLNNMHSTKSKQSDCRGWLRRWMTGKKRLKPRNLSTKKKIKIPIISAVDVDAELESETSTSWEREKNCTAVLTLSNVVLKRSSFGKFCLTAWSFVNWQGASLSKTRFPLSYLNRDVQTDSKWATSDLPFCKNWKKMSGDYNAAKKKKKNAANRFFFPTPDQKTLDSNPQTKHNAT